MTRERYSIESDAPLPADQDLRLLMTLLLAVVVLYCAILGLSDYLPDIVDVHTSLVSIPFQIILVIAALCYVAASSLGYDETGLTLKGWKRSMYESLVLTIPWLLAIVAIKWLATVYHPEMTGEPLLNVQRVIEWHGVSGMAAYAGIYVTMIVAQQFVVRGVLQTSLYRLIDHEQARWIAIVAATVLYSLAHLHISWVFAICTFLPGLFWGWLYSRHQSLVGVACSHALIGLAVFFVVGLDFLR